MNKDEQRAKRESILQRALQQDVPNLPLTEGVKCEIQQIPLHGFCYDSEKETVLQRLKLDKQTLEYACLNMDSYQVVYVPPGYPVEFTAAKRDTVLAGEALALLKDVHSRYGGLSGSYLKNDIVWHPLNGNMPPPHPDALCLVKRYNGDLHFAYYTQAEALPLIGRDSWVTEKEADGSNNAGFLCTAKDEYALIRTPEQQNT